MIRLLPLVVISWCCCGASDAAVSRRAPQEELRPSPATAPEEDPAGLGDGSDPVDEANATKLGMYLGSPCKDACDSKLPHVFCDPVTGLCECEKKFPVRLGVHKGCAKPVRLGDQCFYHETCIFTDQHARCRQINHNAMCQCEAGYHTVALQRPTKRIFCAEDLVLLTTDVPTLFGVATGLAIFTALICFVLKLFSRARYSRPRHYANANLAPPILFSSETGIPLAVHSGRPPSRTSSQRSVGTFTSGFSRRPSSGAGGSRGVLVPASRAGAARAAAILLISCHLTTTTTTAFTATDDASANGDDPLQQQQQAATSRTGSRRPSLSSIHSSASSSRSYSARRFEQENLQREMRQHQLECAHGAASLQPAGGDGPPAPTPSPRTPMSTDELLPSVCELKEECSSLSTSGPSNGRSINSGYHGEIGPCTSTDNIH